MIKRHIEEIQSRIEAFPVKKLANLTRLVSSVYAELVEELEPPEGLRGTCNVEERRLCLSSNRAYEQLFGTFTTQRLW